MKHLMWFQFRSLAMHFFKNFCQPHNSLLIIFSGWLKVIILVNIGLLCPGHQLKPRVVLWQELLIHLFVTRIASTCLEDV